MNRNIFYTGCGVNSVLDVRRTFLRFFTVGFCDLQVESELRSFGRMTASFPPSQRLVQGPQIVLADEYWRMEISYMELQFE